MRALDAIDYVVFDTETTGFHPTHGDEIVAIGAVRIEPGGSICADCFDRLVNPRRPIPRRSQAVHGITDAMVRAAPAAATVLSEFRAWVADAVLVGHNVAFDLKFLAAKEREAGVVFDGRAIDTLHLARFLLGPAEDTSLDGLTQRFAIAFTNRHSALGDARATAAVLIRLLALAQARGMATLEELCRATAMAAAIRAGMAAY